ncbi:hypothetical protein GCM10022403_023610 [Streptomyces coacervatus]|uniref:Uncharacterized protein n=1 Tax=Streptomyces coacervatus TaxID=647381 RepID=A0ABP7H928_9ACTN
MAPATPIPAVLSPSHPPNQAPTARVAASKSGALDSSTRRADPCRRRPGAESCSPALPQPPCPSPPPSANGTEWRQKGRRPDLLPALPYAERCDDLAQKIAKDYEPQGPDVCEAAHERSLRDE